MKTGEYGVRKLRKIQFGIESVAGTAVAASTIWRGIGGLEDQRVATRPNEDVGYLVPTDRVYFPQKGGLLTLDPVPATFEQVQTLFETGIKTVTPVADGGGGNGYISTYPIAMTGPQTVKTRSAETGDNQEVQFGTYFFTREFTLAGNQKEALMMSAVMEGRTSEPQNYTASMVYVNATSKITDAANGLAGFLTGMGIRVFGTVSDDGVYTIGTGGVAGEIVVSQTLPGETAVASTIERYWTPAASLPTVSEILFGNAKVYIDASGGTMGATQKSNTLLGVSYKCKTGQQAKYSGDGRLDLSYIKQVAPEVTIDLTMDWNGVASAERVFAKAGTPRKLRLLFEGPAITAGTAYSKKTLILDTYGTWETFQKLDEQDGDDIITATFVMAQHASANQIILVNILSTPL